MAGSGRWSRSVFAASGVVTQGVVYMSPEQTECYLADVLAGALGRPAQFGSTKSVSNRTLTVFGGWSGYAWGMTYGYEHFHTRLLLDDMKFHGGPKPGEPIPDFDLPTTDGSRVQTDDFAGRPVLITMGSTTCPMTADADAALKQLHERFSDRVGFLTLYVREAHPGDVIPQPHTMDQKMQHARELKRRDQLPWVVGVDDVEGTLHQRLDPKPNAAYLVDADGLVAFRTLWSNDRKAVLTDALEAVVQGRSPVGERQGRMVPMMRGIARMDQVLEKSGPTARHDVRHAAPPVYAMARLAGLTKRHA